MKRRTVSLAALLLGIAPFAVLQAQQQQPEPKCEEMFKNIKVFNGVPAVDLMPAMEFMAASMKWQCTDCHDPKDYAADTENKETARKMILMQREINKNHFNNRPEVTCMSCHNGQEHPLQMPMPDGVRIRHERFPDAPKATDVLAKHIAAVGAEPVMVTFTGTLTGPNDVTHEIETLPMTLTQAGGGKFRIDSGTRQIVSDGTQVTYYGQAMWGEPVWIFQRIARAWRGDKAFAGFEGPGIGGRDVVGLSPVSVVQGSRPTTKSIEELYFEDGTGLLVRAANIKRTSLGTFVTTIDYEDYKEFGKSKFPMHITCTFAGGEKWEMKFDSAKVSTTVDESLFKIGTSQ